MPAIAAAGFQAIAPDLRGYGLTDAPQAIEAYDIHQLTADVIGLLDHYGLARAVIVGHDWGGIVAWMLPLLHPSRIAGVAVLNTPFLARGRGEPVALFRARFGEEMYIVQFRRRDWPKDSSTRTRRARCASSFAGRKATPVQLRRATRPAA